jgi:protoporphyrinogen oxidase
MKTIILGAGASGLGAAWGLVDAGHKNIVILEKNAVVGGLSGSFKSGDVTVDYGPHRFSPEYPELIEKFRPLLGDQLIEVANEHAVIFQGRVYRYPPVATDFLNLPTIKNSVGVLTSFLATRFQGWLKGKNEDSNSPTFEEIIVNGFGPEFYNLVVKPMCLKIWGDPATLDPDFARLRFSVPSFAAISQKLIGRRQVNDQTFFYAKKGFQQFWDVLADYLTSQGVEIKLKASATSIELEKNRIGSLSYRHDEQVYTEATDWVISTIPSQQFVRLLNPNPFSPADLLAQKFVNRGIILVLMVVGRETVLPARVVIAPEAKYSFNRLSEQNQFSRDTVPAGKSAIVADLICEVGGDTWLKPDDEIKNRVVQEVVSCGFFEPAEVERVEVFRIPVAYPLPTLEREKTQRSFNSALSKIENVISTGRFASSDYNNSHTALKKGLLAAKPIVDHMPLGAWYEEVEYIRKAAIRD